MIIFDILFLCIFHLLVAMQNLEDFDKSIFFMF